MPKIVRVGKRFVTRVKKKIDKGIRMSKAKIKAEKKTLKALQKAKRKANRFK